MFYYEKGEFALRKFLPQKLKTAVILNPILNTVIGQAEETSASLTCQSTLSSWKSERGSKPSALCPLPPAFAQVLNGVF